MNTKDCPCKKRGCPRHGKCEQCAAYHAGLKRKRPLACERGHDKSVYGALLAAAACLAAIACLFLAAKRLVFCFTQETLFSRSMVTALSMTVIFTLMLLCCRKKRIGLSVFPKRFGPAYIIATAAAAAFFTVTVFFVKALTLENVLMLLYAGVVTPVFEELLFRGLIWNRLIGYFGSGWKTYLAVTLLFALWHIGYAVGLFFWSGGSLAHIIAMKVLAGLVFGALTGALRYKTHNCYLGILLHGVLNVFG